MLMGKWAERAKTSQNRVFNNYSKICDLVFLEIVQYESSGNSLQTHCLGSVWC